MEVSSIGNIEKLHFITYDIEKYTHDELAEFVCKSGVKWIQLRIKEKPYEVWYKYAVKTKEVCDQYGAKLIVNDHVAIAREIGAYGVHLGQSDMHPNDARKIVGEKVVIGGTANTFEEIKRHVENGVDYIGLGPFKYTKTKMNLSPVLGLEGYKDIINKCRENNINVPIIAIGGIDVQDIEEIMNLGLYGIAISSAIVFANDIVEKSKQFLKAVN